MDDPGAFRLAVALLALLAIGVLAVTQLGPWWRGTTRVSPDVPPPGWVWGTESWRGLARGLPVSLLVGAFTTSAILLSVIDRQASWVALWGRSSRSGLVVDRRPRTASHGLIPPAWRPHRRRLRSRP